MPSTLSGLFKTLAWTDFSQRQGKPPGEGQAATAARTAPAFTATGIISPPVPGSRPQRFQLADSVKVEVTFDSIESFVMSWALTRPQQEQDDLLHHEQGHYNITALVSRDFFIDLMLLRLQTFATSAAGDAAVRQIQQRTLDKIKAIQLLYDKEVHPEQDAGLSRGPIQQDWDSSIQTAFTQPRTPSSQSFDGIVHKVRLVDVLIGNGKKV